MSKYLYLECDCHDLDHLLRFYREDPEDGGWIGVSVQMSHYLSFWSRLRVAAAFLLGATPKCHFTDTILKPDQKAQLIEWLSEDVQ